METNMNHKFAKLLIVALGCVVLISKSAHAGPMRDASWATLAVGQGGDIYTTYHNLPMGGGRCVELNSGVYGSNPNLGRLLLGKAVFAVPLTAASIALDRKHDKTAHTAANILRFAAGGVGGVATGWNLTRQCR
jgi:hypothetical protein